MSTSENHLIELLPRADRLRLLAGCEAFQLVPAEVLCEPGHPTRHVYFPTDGSISLVGLNHGSRDLEVGMVGREGMLGAQVALGVVTAPWRALVQGAGLAWRIDTAVFRRELARSATLQRGVNRYLYVLMAQMAQMAALGACPSFHAIGPRLARWLLMSQDRAHCDHLQVTQELLAYRLGVRRVSITSAASAMQRSGLIAYHRGDLTVLDRRGLEAAACGCYAADRLAYSALL